MNARSWRACLIAALVGGGLCSSGCTSARWVQYGPDGGVVAIPNNTNWWPSYHRDKAMALIREKCPDYEIVAEEEVVVGQTAHTNTETDVHRPGAVVVGGGNKRGGAGVAVPLGPTQRSTVQTTTYEDVREWRITYRPRRGSGLVGPAGGHVAPAGFSTSTAGPQGPATAR